MSDTGPWSAERFAQELVARGFGPMHAISTVRDFEREWEPERARRNAIRRFWDEHMTEKPPEGAEKQREWAMELRRMALTAGEKAACEARAYLSEALK